MSPAKAKCGLTPASLKKRFKTKWRKIFCMMIHTNKKALWFKWKIFALARSRAYSKDWLYNQILNIIGQILSKLHRYYLHLLTYSFLLSRIDHHPIQFNLKIFPILKYRLAKTSRYLIIWLFILITVKTIRKIGALTTADHHKHVAFGSNKPRRHPMRWRFKVNNFKSLKEPSSQMGPPSVPNCEKKITKNKTVARPLALVTMTVIFCFPNYTNPLPPVIHWPSLWSQEAKARLPTSCLFYMLLYNSIDPTGKRKS